MNKNINIINKFILTSLARLSIIISILSINISL